jgi:hypothetical protein
MVVSSGGLRHPPERAIAAGSITDMVQTIEHRAGDLFDIASVEPRRPRGGDERMPDTFNLDFRYNGRSAPMLAGGGIYVVCYRRELLYIGIFTGKDRKAFVSNVASERFYKHLEALTLRGRSVGFTARNYDTAIALDRPDCPLIGILRGTRVPRGNGAVKTYPCKVEFASDNWNDFSCIERDRAVLDRFTFLYGRVDATHFRGGADYQQVKNYLGAIESDLILGHGPRCNERRARINGRHLAVGPPRDAWIVFEKLVRDHIARPGNGEAA